MHRLDERWMLGVNLDLLSQTRDLRINRPLIGMPAGAMGNIHQMLPAQNTAWVFQKHRQKLEFTARQRDVVSVWRNQLSTLEDCSPAFETQRRSASVICSCVAQQAQRAQNLLCSRQNFAKVKRFADVIVSAELKSDNPVNGIFAGADDNNRTSPSRIQCSQLSSPSSTPRLRSSKIKS